MKRTDWEKRKLIDDANLCLRANEHNIEVMKYKIKSLEETNEKIKAGLARLELSAKVPAAPRTLSFSTYPAPVSDIVSFGFPDVADVEDEWTPAAQEGKSKP